MSTSPLVSRKSLRSAKDNKDLFEILFENRILSEPVRASMTKMARFRDLVVYNYARIDPEIVLGILRHDSDDLRRFAAEVLDYLATR